MICSDKKFLKTHLTLKGRSAFTISSTISVKSGARHEEKEQLSIRGQTFEKGGSKIRARKKFKALQILLDPHAPSVRIQSNTR